MTRKMRLELGLLKVGEIAREARVHKSTVRYYTEIGLLKVKETTEGGYRLYDRDDALMRIDLTRKANEGCLNLGEIKTRLN